MEKEILLRIRQAKVNFTSVEEIIAQYFLDGNPPVTIHELSRKLSISSSSITRFCKKIGLKNYKELLYLYEHHLNDPETTLSNLSFDLQGEYFRIFSLIDRHFDLQDIKKVCQHIYEHRLIHIFALGLSATAAEDFRFRFSRLGKFVEVIHDKDAIKMSSRVLQKDDLVFIFTLRGNRYFENLAIELKKKNIIVISILGNENSRLAETSNIVLKTSSLSGEESTGMISSQIPILIMIDILYGYYVKTYSDALTNWISTEEILKD